jgi:hypothetical protein
MASIRRKGPHWQVVWNVYEDGRRRQMGRNFDTQAKAREYRAKVELLEQRGVSSVQLSLGAYLDDWLAEKRVEPNTEAGYRRWIQHIKRSHVATLALRRITAHELERLYSWLLGRPAGHGKPLSPVSVRLSTPERRCIGGPE